MEVAAPEEASLLGAWRLWQPWLEAPVTLDRLSEAIRISAAFHPKYHFLESGLHTELGMIHLQHGEWQSAQQHFARAVFLHHDNQEAILGERYAREHLCTPLPAYRFAAVNKADFWEAPQTQFTTTACIFTLRETARTTQIPADYESAIALCERTHQHYHRLAALPWRTRAHYFKQTGEPELAENDLRRGRDLAPSE